MILVGNMWKGLIQWVQEIPLRKNLLDQKDIDKLQIVEKMDDVIPILEKEINNFYNKKQ
jgi:predicted Rossmann-fold nucleotide-binding protein